jgi:NAD(P)-dependent dehydrogenase (short-subunit alcohol dehydrogenase family)
VLLPGRFLPPHIRRYFNSTRGAGREPLGKSSRTSAAQEAPKYLIISPLRGVSPIRGSANREESTGRRQFGHSWLELEIVDFDWFDAIEGTFDGTANAFAVFAPKTVARRKAAASCFASRRQASDKPASYSTSQWGFLALMKAAMMELGQRKITTNALIPGLVDTPLTY